jgi:DNA-binding PadR family transcriptional regulator
VILHSTAEGRLPGGREAPGEPRHGYELIKDLEAKFGGGYAASSGSVYPTLTLMEELGHIRTATSEGTKRLFEITADGRAYLRENEAALNSALARMDMAARARFGRSAPRRIFTTRCIR